jgi:hypothetical protein
MYFSRMPITPVTKLLFSRAFVRKEYPVLLNRLIKSNSDINISTSNTDDDIDSSAFDDTDDNSNNSYSSECSNNEGKLYIACYNLFSDVI